jgi:enoyl-CoA hydratase
MSVEVDVDSPEEGITRVTLDRPAKRNAINAAMVGRLHEAFRTVRTGVIVLTGTGNHAFCSGIDLSVTDDERLALSDRLYELYAVMLRSPTPIIAAIQGAAVGGGAQLALASDVRIAAPHAWLQFPGAGHGLAVGAWGLPSLVGRGRALAMCWSMERVGAETARRDGLVDAVADDAEAAAIAQAAQLLRLDPEAVARGKRIVGIAAGLDAALAEERHSNRVAWSGSVLGLEGGSGVRT